MLKYRFCTDSLLKLDGRYKTSGKRGGEYTIKSLNKFVMPCSVKNIMQPKLIVYKIRLLRQGKYLLILKKHDFSYLSPV